MESLLARLEPVGYGWHRIPKSEGIIDLVSQHVPDDVALRWGDFLRVIAGKVIATAWPAGDTTEVRIVGDSDDEPIRYAAPRAWGAYAEAARQGAA